MEFLREELLKKLQIPSDLLISPQYLMHVVKDQGYSKLGDAYINWLYSVAKTFTVGPTGTKVSDSILAKSYRDSNLTFLGFKGNKNWLADIIEAFLLVTWLTEQMTFSEMVNILRQHLKPDSMKHHNTELVNASYAFTQLLNTVAERVFKRDRKVDN